MSENKLYKINDEGHYLFREDHAKIKNFFEKFLAVFSAFIALFIVRARRMGLDVKRNLVSILVVGAIAAFLTAIYFVFFSKNHVIEISDETVKITIGRMKWAYPVTSFVRAEIEDSSFRQGNLIMCKLVFISASGEEKVDLGAIDIYRAHDISKTIFMFQERHGGRLKRETAEPFDGDVYIGVHNQINSGKFRKIVIGLVIAIVIMIIALVLPPNDPSELDAFSYSGGIIISALLLLTIVALGIVLWHIFKTTSDSKMLYLTFADSELKINGRTFLISDIDAVKMTAPEVTGTGFCYLEVFTKYDQKPERFIAGKQLDSGMTEQERSEGCSCEYPSLYQAIKEFCISNEIKFS